MEVTAISQNGPCSYIVNTTTPGGQSYHQNRRYLKTELRMMTGRRMLALLMKLTLLRLKCP